MKNKSLILFAVAFVLLLVIATVLYPKLSESYLSDKETGETTESVTNTEAQTTDIQTPEIVIQTDDFTVYDANGKEVKLSEQFGKPIVVNFWATWCPPCRSELPAFDNAYREYGEDIVFMMVDLTDGYQETKKKVDAFLAETGYSFPVYYDLAMDAAYTYGAYSIPETLFINADGSLEDIRIGAMTERDLNAMIDRLLENAK